MVRQNRTLRARSREAHPSRLVLLGTAIPILLLAVLGWAAWGIHRSEVRERERVHLLARLGSATALDEALTRVTRMAAVTGEAGWFESHEQLGFQMRDAIRGAHAGALFVGAEEAARRAGIASLQMARMERDALALVRQGRGEAALQLISTDEYNAEKSRFADAVAELSEAVQRHGQRHSDTIQRHLLWGGFLLGTGAAGLFVVWGVVFTRLCRYVSERDRAEEALRQREHRFRAVIDNSPNGVFVKNADGRFVLVNEAFAALCGCAPGEILGRTEAELRFAPDTVERFRRADQQVIETAETLVLPAELVTLPRTGERRWLETRKAPLPTPDGRIQVLGIVVDVTDRRRAEERERELIREHAAREGTESAQRRIRGILESITDAFYALDENWCFTYVNAQAEALFGVPRGELLGHSFWRLFPEAKELEFYPRYHRAVEEQVAVSFEEYSPRAGRWLQVRAYPYEEGLTVYLRDITIRKQAEEALRNAKARAEAASRAKSELLSRTSHELRTPLNAVLGFAQLLEMEVEREESRESVEEILRAGRHLLRLVDEVLDIAGAESGELTLAVEPVPVEEVLQQALAVMRPLARQRQVEIPARLSEPCAHTVIADPQRLKQVLLNLLSNAIKYNREGGEVEIGCRESASNRLRLEVRDTGPGIPPEKLGRLFHPFDRLDAEKSGPGTTAGTGLGLALSKALTEAMGGRVGAESTPGEGSTFWLELPMVGEQTEHSGEEAFEAEPPAGSASGGAPVVLYVEDTPANLRLVERILGRSRPQLELISAMQGSSGLAMARDHRPDLILLDLNLPDLHGEEVLERLRRDSRTQAIPVVVVSGDASPEQVERMQRRGAAHYLTKPFSVERFLEVVDEALAPPGPRRDQGLQESPRNP